MDDNVMKMKLLPSLYKMENYTLCERIRGNYCNTDFKVSAKDPNCLAWRVIQESFLNKYTYDHTKIHRLICIPNDIQNYSSKLIFAQNSANKELAAYNLTASVINIQCMRKDIVTDLDYGVLFGVALFLFLLAIGTWYDRKKKLKQPDNTSSITNNIYIFLQNIILSFSIPRNWRQLMKIGNSDDYKNLRSIQGIRFYSTVFVIWFHTKVSFAQLYLRNTEWMENQHLLSLVFVFDVFIVQVYFLISAWLLANKMLSIYYSKGNITIKHCGIIILNRYIRLLPLLVFAVLFFASYPVTSGTNRPMTFDLMEITKSACSNYWWYTCLAINNFVFFNMMCHPGTWYITIDMQFYVIAVVILYAVLKLRLNYKYVLTCLIILSCVVYGVIIYMNDQDIIFRMYPENLRRQNYFFSRSFRILYLSFYSSWTSSIIGIWFGILYYKTKHTQLEENSVLARTCSTLFILLPCFVIMVSTNEYKGLAAAVIGPLMKPLFTLGIAIGILGMSKNFSGLAKKICEWDFAVFMGNFTYSTHVFHVAIVFARGNASYDLFKIGTYELFRGMVIDLTLSLLMGFLITVFFEQVFRNMQKVVVPQIKKGS